MMTKKIIFIIVSALIFCDNAFCYDDKITHRDITSNAVSKSMVGSFLIDSLKFEAGIDTNIPTNSKNTILTLLMRGSTEEDSPNCRAASHFLNPLKDWDIAGVSDTNETIFGAFVNSACFVTAPFSSKFSINKYSDVTWATGYTSPTVQGEATGNDMDWNAARNYYRLALTATDNATREAYFAQTFQALGQVMHLVQDMAVPAHVRNDFTAHLAFQKLNGLLPSKWYGNTYEWYVKNNESLVNSAMANSTVVPPPNNLLTALWDANKYDGNNPSGGTVQGLAEYTNANFFSESTIFAELKDPTDIHYFPRPNKADTNALEQEMLATTMEVTAEDGVQDRTIHVTKKTGGYKVAAYSFLGQRVARRIVADGIAPFSYVSEWEYNLDDEVYKDYIQKLIPRAVGYSAGLLDYFFRGQIDMTAESGQYVIKNESDEAMSGTFRLYYDDTNGMRQLVPTADWYLSITANGKSSPVTFTAPSDAKEAGKYMLVFLGTHGAESGAVVGKKVTLQSKDGIIKIRLTGPDGGQIKRDIIFNVWAKRKDTGATCKIAAASWKYDDVAGYWEVTVPSLSDAIEYNAAYNRYDTVTPVGGFDLAQGVYLDYLWKAASVGVWPTTYMGKPTWYQPTYEEEVGRNFGQNPATLGLKTGYKPNIQPIPGIEILTVFPKDNYNNYSIQLVYDAAKKQIDLAGGTRLVVAANDEGVYGLSQKGYSSMIIKVTPSSLPATNYSAEFSINSGRLDKSRIIKTGSIWTQYPGKYMADQRYLPASKLDLKQNMVLGDVIPYIYTEQTSDVSALYANQMQVSSIELNSNMKYTIKYNGAFYGALWRCLDGESEIGLYDFAEQGYCWIISQGDSSNVLWDNVNGKCGSHPGYSPLSWVPSGRIAWVDTDTGSYSLFPVSLIQYKNFEFIPGARTHYIKFEHAIPSILTVTSENKSTNYTLQQQYPRISKSLTGPNILLRD